MLCIQLDAYAAQYQQFGDLEVHYVVVNTSFLSPQVANTYGITRGKHRAIVNISILDTSNDPVGVPRKAVVSGRSRDLISSQELEFREIREQSSIYYIADFKFLNAEHHRFEISLIPDADAPPLLLKFEQKVYVD
jgi:hypothetical protein